MRSELKGLNEKRKEWNLIEQSMRKTIDKLKANNEKLLAERNDLKSQLLQQNESNEQKENSQKRVKLQQILKEWELQRYETILIEEFGFDDFLDWKDIEENELIKDMNFKMGHARKFVRKTREYFDVMNEENQKEGNVENELNDTPFI